MTRGVTVSSKKIRVTSISVLLNERRKFGGRGAGGRGTGEGVGEGAGGRAGRGLQGGAGETSEVIVKIGSQYIQKSLVYNAHRPGVY